MLNFAYFCHLFVTRFIYILYVCIVTSKDISLWQNYLMTKELADK